MKMRLKNPNKGYNLAIKFPNPKRDIIKAVHITRKIALLNFILKVFSSVRLIENTSETSVENISSHIIIKSIDCTIVPNLWDTKRSGIS